MLLLALLFASLANAQVISTMGGVAASSVRDLHKPNLISEWRFDEGSGDTLTDYPGSNDGQLGSAAGADANDPDWVTAGLDFATSGDRVELLTLTFDPNASAWTISLVAFYDAASVADRTLWSQQDGTGTGRSILISDSTDDTLGSFLGGTETSATQTISSGYHHLTLTYNGAGTLTYYVDGDAGVTASATPEAANGAHWIGSNKSGLGTWDEPVAWALYYSDELTAAENNNNCRVLASHLGANRGLSFTCN